MNKIENIEKLESALNRLVENESIVYFLTYDTKTNARAAVKHIYDMALTLKNNGVNAKILVEDKSYSGVESWLGESYNEIPVVSIKDDKIEIKKLQRGLFYQKKGLNSEWKYDYIYKIEKKFKSKCQILYRMPNIAAKIMTLMIFTKNNKKNNNVIIESKNIYHHYRQNKWDNKNNKTIPAVFEM